MDADAKMISEPHWRRRHALFDVVSGNEFSFTLRDTGHAAGHPTITNDAEYVVQSLARLWKIEGMRIFYYDSDGELSELLHDGPKFTGFAP